MARGGGSPADRNYLKDADLAYGVLGTARFHSTISIGEYEREHPFSKGRFTPTKTIVLPLPEELRDDTAVNYNRAELQLVGDVINGAGVSQTIGAEILRQSGDLLSGTVAGAASLFGLGDAAGRALDASSITSALQQSIGVAPNPNPSVAFQGPDLREYTLTWTFMPTNEKDSNAVRKIINLLKASALPSNRYQGSTAILNYPAVVQLNFYPWDTGGGGKYGWSKNSIIRAKRSFMSAVNVRYSEGVSPAFFGGNKEPVTIQLVIAFKEIEYHLASDWIGDGKFDGSGLTGSVIDEITGEIGKEKDRILNSDLRERITPALFEPPATDDKDDTIEAAGT